MPNNEPEILQQGKNFHKTIQDDWRRNAEGRLFFEFTTDLAEGKTGRMDILVRESQSYVAVGEIKNSDWDRMSDLAVKRNVKRQIRQVWGYIHSQLRLAHDVTPGVIFPRKPIKQGRMELIEAHFEADGIAVVWNDETSEDRKYRSERR